LPKRRADVAGSELQSAPPVVVTELSVETGIISAPFVALGVPMPTSEAAPEPVVGWGVVIAPLLPEAVLNVHCVMTAAGEEVEGNKSGARGPAKADSGRAATGCALKNSAAKPH